MTGEASSCSAVSIPGAPLTDDCTAAGDAEVRPVPCHVRWCEGEEAVIAFPEAVEELPVA